MNSYPYSPYYPSTQNIYNPRGYNNTAYVSPTGQYGWPMPTTPAYPFAPIYPRRSRRRSRRSHSAPHPIPVPPEPYSYHYPSTPYIPQHQTTFPLNMQRTGVYSQQYPPYQYSPLRSPWSALPGGISPLSPTISRPSRPRTAPSGFQSVPQTPFIPPRTPGVHWQALHEQDCPRRWRGYGTLGGVEFDTFPCGHCGLSPYVYHRPH
ncbi:hypothetical protein BDN72DRAFT_217115 [Pluteus cervinus]|uniref:Uncharacterized protein n=1 Tax=Pluteus cervinus TaxID=181527 RepID=A0ACD3B6K6_9AGAR|nr:hypothetical protein BDN72DRAFT_217115 [Pluteus cervinus]